MNRICLRPPFACRISSRCALVALILRKVGVSNCSVRRRFSRSPRIPIMVCDIVLRGICNSFSMIFCLRRRYLRILSATVLTCEDVLFKTVHVHLKWFFAICKKPLRKCWDYITSSLWLYETAKEEKLCLHWWFKIFSIYFNFKYGHVPFWLEKLELHHFSPTKQDMCLIAQTKI